MACHVASCHVMSHVYTAKQAKQMRIPFDPESLSNKHFIIYIYIFMIYVYKYSIMIYNDM